MSPVAVISLVVLGLVVVVLLLILRSAVNIVQQGQVGVVKRLGEYRHTHEPGLVLILPFIDSLQTRRHARGARARRPPGRHHQGQRVVTVNATIFTQVVDAKQALFSVKNFDIAIDALARTALRSVIGTMTLDEALSERERINTDVQEQMEVVTDKWGIRISRIEIVEIAPPPQILQALALQKQADQEKRAQHPAVRGPPACRPSTWPRARRKAAVRAAEGRARVRHPPGRGPPRRPPSSRREGRAAGHRAPSTRAIKNAAPDQTLVAILQLETLAKFADSDNAKIVVPFESVGLMGAAQALRSVLGPEANGATP